MKLSTLVKDTCREMLRSRERFISIALITFLSVGFFVGVKATAPSMRATAENYFNASSLMDLEIISTVGFDDSDVASVRNIEGVKGVMPSYSADLIVVEDSGNSVARVCALPNAGEKDTLNQIQLVAGRLPENPGECIAVPYRMRDDDIAVGDVIKFSDYAGQTATDTIISGKEYTVVGLMKSPQQFSYSYGNSSIGNGIIMYYIMLPAAEFKYSRYTELYVLLNRAAGVTAFDERYDSNIRTASDLIDAAGRISYAQFLQKIKTQITDAEIQLNTQKTDAERKLEDAKRKLDEAKLKLEQSKAEIEAGWTQYNEGVQKSKTELYIAESKLAESRKQISDGKTQLAVGQAKYKEGEAQLQKSRDQLDSGWAQYNAGLAEYNSNEALYNDGYNQYTEAKEKYEPVLKIYNTAKQAVAMAEAALNGNEVDQAEAAALFAEAQAELQDYLDSGGSDPAVIAQLQEQIQAAADRVANAEDQNAQVQIELENARKQLEGVQIQLEQAEAQLAAAETQLQQARNELDKAKATLDSAFGELQSGETQYAVGKKKLDESYALLKANILQLESGEKKLKEGEDEFNKQKAAALAQLAQAKAKLEDAEKQLAAGQKDYDKGYADYLNGYAQMKSAIADGANRILNVQNMYSSVESGKWYAFTRDDIIQSYAGFNQDSERINAIAAIFPVFFLMVASLVCLTTMSRMIDEQRVQIGTYKALGYSSAQIAGKYMVYSAIACILGSVLGQVICIQILPRVIIGAYSALYRLPEIEITVPWSMSFLSLFVALLCTVMVAWYSCYKELKRPTAALMRPKMPRSGRKILLERFKKLWASISFSQKITARNLFRYKVRLMMTVLGISGCMALIVAGFGMRDGINPIVDKQYGEINRYRIMFTLSKELARPDAAAFGQQLAQDNRLKDTLFSKIVSAEADKNGEVIRNVFVLAPEDSAQMEKLIALRDPKSGSALKLGDEGVILTDKLAQIMHLGAGDKITFTVNEVQYTLPVTAVTENYIYHYIYMSPALYEKTFGKDIAFNSIACAANENMTDFDSFSSEWLAKDSSILSIVSIDSARKSFVETINSINVIILVLLISAGALAFVVVYNLTNINISERTREIATIKVLGFKHSETNMYIFRENFIMGAVGIVLGGVLGYFLAQFMLQTVEADMVRFARDIAAVSYLYAALLTAFYIVSVNLLMTKRMKNISMVESLKAVE